MYAVRMSEREELSAIFSALDARAKKDRRPALEGVQAALEDETFIHFLNENSKEEGKSSNNWDLLLIKAHAIALNDVDENENKITQLSMVYVDLMQSVLSTICHKSVIPEFGPQIKCNTIISSILSVFESNPRRKYFGHMYFQILSSCVLKQRKYLGEISTYHWIELKKLCVSVYKETHAKCEQQTILDALCNIVRYGCKNSLAGNSFVDLLPFLQEIHSSPKTSSLIECSLLRLTNMVCLQFAVQFRYKVCAFMEDIFPDMIGFHGKKDNACNPFVYHFLITDINVHNPAGVGECDAAAYAHNWTRWKRQVKDIFLLCSDKANQLVRDREKIDDEDEFLALMVEVTHLVFSDGFRQFDTDTVNEPDTSYCEPGPSSKRKRSIDTATQSTQSTSSGRKFKQIKLDNDFNTVLESIQTSDAYFWLKYLAMILEKYPSIIKKHYTRSLEVLSQIFSEKRDAGSFKLACRCLCLILNVKTDCALKNDEADVHWHRFSEASLRTFMNNTSCSELHLVIRSLLSHQKLKDPMQMVDLYCRNVLEPSIDNFATLLAISRNCVLPEVVPGREANSLPEHVRMKLLGWVMTGNLQYSVNDLSKLLITLSSKRSDEHDVTLASIDTPLSACLVDDLCKLITQNYEKIAFRNLKLSEDVKPADRSAAVKIDSKVMIELVGDLQIRCSAVLNNLKDSSFDRDEQIAILKDSLYYCNLLLRLLSDFKNLGISEQSEKSLMTSLQELFYISTTKALDLMQTQPLDLSVFAVLYYEDYHQELQATIREKTFTDLKFLKFLFGIVKSRPAIGSSKRSRQGTQNAGTGNFQFSDIINSPQSILNASSLTGEVQYVISAAETLCQYIAAPGCSSPNEFQTALSIHLTENLIKDDTLNFNTDLHLILVLRVLYNMTNLERIRPDVLNNCLILIHRVMKEKFADSEIAIPILQIMKKLTRQIHRIEETQANFLKLLNNCRENIVEKRSCGPKTISKYIECLVEIAKTDSDKKWTANDRDEFVFEEIVTFLQHPCNEVRLTAAQSIGCLFLSTNDKTKSFQKRVLEALYQTLLQEEQPTPKDKNTVLEYDYCRVVTTSTALLSWAHVVCVSSFWRKSALFCFVRLVFEKKFDKKQVTDAMRLIHKELGVADGVNLVTGNFQYLFSKWIEEKYKPQDFPFYLLDCHTVDKFYSSHINVLVPLCLQNGQMDVINTIANKLNMQLETLVRQCHPALMAHVLPLLNENATVTDTQKAQRIQTFVEKYLSETESNKLLVDNLDEVIFYMIQNVHDPTFLSRISNGTARLNEEKPFICFTVEQVVAGLQKLSPREDCVLLGYVALEKPSVIQKVLFSLLREVESGVTYEEKINAVCRYVSFVMIVSSETKGDINFRKVNSFIIRDVIYTLSNVIREDTSKVLTTMSCWCLKNLAEKYLQNFSDLFAEFLPVITTVIVPLVKTSQEALDVLNFLICANYAKLRTAIDLLDPFPSDDVFDEINSSLAYGWESRSLKEEIEHFIATGNNKNSGCRIEGLKHLHRSLDSKKGELKTMYDDLRNMRGFSEDCRKSLLHQLICMLAQLTRNKIPAVRTEASKCLGELGPADLTTLVLRPENDFHSTPVHETPFQTLLKSSIISLSDLIISNNLEVKKFAAKALYAILSTKEGNCIVSDRTSYSINLDHLTPFRSISTTSTATTVDADEFVLALNNVQLWIAIDHETWITNLAVAFLSSIQENFGMAAAFTQLCKVNFRFAEEIFPPLLDYVLLTKDPTCIEVINRNVNMFFSEHFNSLKEQKPRINQTSVQCLVNVVDYIRIKRNLNKLYNKIDLEVNYLHIAQASLYCSAFFTAILYAELWCEEKKEEAGTSLNIDQICEMFPEEGTAITKILRECYSKIGNSDGIHGCGYMHLLDRSTEIQYYEHLKKWYFSVLYYDIELSQGRTQSNVGLLNGLQNCGLDHTLSGLIRSSGESDFQYKSAIKLGDWSLLDSTYKANSSLTSDSYDKCHYFVLKSFHCEDDITFHSEIAKARKCVINELSNCSLESTKNLYQPLSRLQCLKELEDFSEVKRTPVDMGCLYRKWCEQDLNKCSEFRLIETVMSQRALILKEEMERTKMNDVKSCLQSFLFEIYSKLTKTAREEKHYEIAERNLNFLKSMTNVPEHVSGEMQIEKARILWETGERNIAKFFLSQWLNQSEVRGELKSYALRIYGDWMAETKSENAHQIIELYYCKSIEESTNQENQVDAYASLAKFAYGNYDQLSEYLSSPLFEVKQDLVKKQQDLASDLQQDLYRNQNNRDKKFAFLIASKQSVIDENEIKNVRREKDLFLNLALKYYLLTLKEGDKYDLNVFRVISLWLSNYQNEDVVQNLKDTLDHIPSYKFLCILPQIVPRMVEVSGIDALIQRTVQDHPHHALPLLFALAKSYEDLKYSRDPRTSKVSPTPRVAKAQKLIETLGKTRKFQKMISQMDEYCEALIELANHQLEGNRPQPAGSSIGIKSHLKIARLSSCESVLMPSLTIPYKKDCDYRDVVGVQSFEKKFMFVGGVNVPKRVKCLGTDGIERALLIKGKDDLRQDAVMQQVFTVMNSLLNRNKEANKRKLVIRTYKVVPLSQRSGIIEWCDNTQPLGLYLAGSDSRSGAHKRFNPTDLMAAECRMRVRDLAQKTNREKLDGFLEVCRQFHPAFHHFFIENFPTAGVWFERRLAYTHSVATSSMIGYILGIGDRHVHNILVDNATAEVIHIDLGIAFEQGKTLPTPETVPFRLSRDIEDGMGVSKTEGVFRLSCMKTMEVLRENQDTILTLLEVLLYDPLYAWTITPEKARFVQSENKDSIKKCKDFYSSNEGSSPDVEVNKVAERALIRLKQKLQGTEDGGVATTVEGQINYLIQAAKDPTNLCRMFNGWQAYLWYVFSHDSLKHCTIIVVHLALGHDFIS